jgi:hypothetical protein
LLLLLLCYCYCYCYYCYYCVIVIVIIVLLLLLLLLCCGIFLLCCDVLYCPFLFLLILLKDSSIFAKTWFLRGSVARSYLKCDFNKIYMINLTIHGREMRDASRLMRVGTEHARISAGICVSLQ